MSSSPEPPKLSVPNIFGNFLLVHDFFQRLCKSQPHRPQFFDLQFDIQKKVQKAGKRGAHTFQGALFVGLLYYCLKGNSKLLKMAGGLVYVRWINHFYTLGSYLGVMTVLPGVVKKTEKYYSKYPKQKNLLTDLRGELNKYDDSEIDKALDKIFPKQHTVEQSTYVSNNFFTANKSYFFKDQNAQDNGTDDKTQISAPQKLKLRYFDSFITRYIYHNMKRWVIEVRNDFKI